MDNVQTALELKQYHCSVCGDNFKRHEHLVRHARRHTQEKPFKCDICLKEFARRDILSRHAIVHIPPSERAAMPPKTQKRGAKRVQQACNNCARGKCRCDGETPCSTCQSRGIICEYTMSAPVKRKRADSSASTAAANVLLQVASSANASPKGDWTMDYPINAGLENHIAMQPHSVIFGYQPSLQGPMPHDTYSFDLQNASRPLSRFTSRATSPRREYHHNSFADPVASSLSFLFNNTKGIQLSDIDPPLSRDVNGIVLPKKMDLNSPSNDSTAQGQLDTRLYSSIDSRQGRLDTGLDSYNVPTPLTEADRSLLQTFAQVNLPELSSLNTYLKAYFSLFHATLPILHKPSFSPHSSAPVLLMAVLGVGSLYAEPSNDAEGSDLIQRALHLVEIDQNGLALLQAQLLLDYVCLCDVRDSGTIAALQRRQTVAIDRARSRNLFEELFEDPMINGHDVEKSWRLFCEAEERRRLSWAYLLLDTQSSMLLGAAPALDLNELKSSLPCHETVWNAPTAIAWNKCFEADQYPKHTRSLWTIGRLEDRGLDDCKTQGAWCRNILAYVEARRVYNIGYRHMDANTDQLTSFQRDFHDDADVFSENVTNMAQSAFTILCLSFSEHDRRLSQLEANTLVNILLGRFLTFLDPAVIRNALAEGPAILKAWITTDARRARGCLHLACFIVGLILQEKIVPPLAGLISLYCVSTIVGYGQYCFHFSSLSELDMATCHPDTAVASDWYRDGGAAPTVFGIQVCSESGRHQLVAGLVEKLADMPLARRTIITRLSFILDDLREPLDPRIGGLPGQSLSL